MSVKVSFQGIKGAYSEEAALGYFVNKNIILSPKDTFDEVFQAIESETVDYGVLPIENSLAGIIHQNYDLLLHFNLWIVGEIKHRVSHNLMCIPESNIENIQKVYSHPQALMQCRAFLKSQSSFQDIPHYDTAGAAKFVAEQKNRNYAAIASKIAAKEYGLKILAEATEDNPLNFTRFLILQKKQTFSLDAISSEEAKTSIVFNLKSIPGALHKALSIFAIRDINLQKIESRPIQGNPWNYMFYLDFVGKISDEKCMKAVEHLREISEFVKVLGSYRAAQMKS